MCADVYLQSFATHITDYRLSIIVLIKVCDRDLFSYILKDFQVWLAVKLRT